MYLDKSFILRVIIPFFIVDGVVSFLYIYLNSGNIYHYIVTIIFLPLLITWITSIILVNSADCENKKTGIFKNFSHDVYFCISLIISPTLFIVISKIVRLYNEPTLANDIYNFRWQIVPLIVLIYLLIIMAKKDFNKKIFKTIYKALI